MFKVKMIQLFLPQNFTVRGGDADGVNIELLLRRMSNKARIIQTHAVDKFQLDHASGDPIRTEGQAWAAELCDLLEVRV